MNVFMKKCFLIVVMFAYVVSAKAHESTYKSGTGYFFWPGNEITLPPNGRDTLRIDQSSVTNPGLTEANIISAQWTIDGKGYTNQNTDEGSFKLAKLQFQKGIYTAPAQVPPHNPVDISVSFQPPGEKTKIVLYCRIHIIDKENYFYLSDNRNTAGGTLYELKEPLISSMRNENAYYTHGEWLLMVEGFRKIKDNRNSMQQMSIDVGFIGDKTGSYTWTFKWNESQGAIPPYNSVSVEGIGKDGKLFEDLSSDCVPHGCGGAHGDDCKKCYALEGTTTVTVFDKLKKIIKGYFSGILVTPTGQYVSVSGAFSTKMME